MESIKLKQPLKVNGEDRKELPYDIDAVSIDQFIKAESLAKSHLEDFTFSTAENDYSFHLGLGLAAIMAADPSIDKTDLDRVTGIDLMQIMRVGRNFMQASSESQEEPESESEESKSSGRSETSPTSSTVARTKS